jgi:hypothetical protein
MRPTCYRYTKSQYKSYQSFNPLKSPFKQFCAVSGFEPDTIGLCLPLKKRGRRSCYHYTQPHWLTPGFEPCSSVAQTDALPDKLEPTFVIEIRVELIFSESKSDMLPLHHSIFFAVRMRIELITSDRQSGILAIILTNR